MASLTAVGGAAALPQEPPGATLSPSPQAFEAAKRRRAIRMVQCTPRLAVAARNA
jgi:hypothetical protein